MASDVIAAAIDLAASHNVTQIVVGRARSRFWRRLLGRTLSQQLVRRAGPYALHVVPMETEAPRVRAKRVPEQWWEWAVAAALVAGVTGLGMLVVPPVPDDAFGMVYVTAVVGAAIVAGCGRRSPRPRSASCAGTSS